MTDFNPIDSYLQNYDYYKDNNPLSIDMAGIDSIFVTSKKEKNRTTFNETFREITIDKRGAKQGKNFLQGIEKNKEEFCNDLKMNSEEYDALSCVALALASQETGMGLEALYKEENRGLLGMTRNIAKLFDSKKGNGSASSGLTQMKIHDFITSPSFDEDKKKLFKKYGIEDLDASTNNLYSYPDKAAAATMIVLSELVTTNYDRYKDILEENHNNLREKLNPDLSDIECAKKGFNLIDSIKTRYNSLDDKSQEECRIAFKDWLLAYNGSVNTDEYKAQNPNHNNPKFFEDIQLGKLNAFMGFEEPVKQEDLDYIRYALSTKGNAMTPVEYCAYAWNKGSGATGMQFDRLIAEKIGTIFSNPENFDYDQFSVNVSTLADKYAQKAHSDIDVLNILLESYSSRISR